MAEILTVSRMQFLPRSWAEKNKILVKSPLKSLWSNPEHWFFSNSFITFSYIKSVSPKRVVTILYHCAFNADFLANSYFISKICHAKSFKMRYIMSLYKPFWKYESWFCSEVSKLTLSNYPWNDANFTEISIKNIYPIMYHNFWSKKNGPKWS